MQLSEIDPAPAQPVGLALLRQSAPSDADARRLAALRERQAQALASWADLRRAVREDAGIPAELLPVAQLPDEPPVGWDGDVPNWEVAFAVAGRGQLFAGYSRSWTGNGSAWRRRAWLDMHPDRPVGEPPGELWWRVRLPNVVSAFFEGLGAALAALEG